MFVVQAQREVGQCYPVWSGQQKMMDATARRWRLPTGWMVVLQECRRLDAPHSSKECAPGLRELAEKRAQHQKRAQGSPGARGLQLQVDQPLGTASMA